MFGLDKLAGAMGHAFGGGMGAAATGAGGGLKEALMQRALSGGAAQSGQLPTQANGTPQGVPFGGGPPNPPTQASGLWAKMMGTNKQMMNGSMPPQQPAVPAVPPNQHARIPPAVDRFVNAQRIQDAYRNNWQPNPVLLRAELGK
jgi:hypothetical protein